jgi:hypothetical protein
MNDTTWKDIPGYEALYRINNKGDVLSLTYGKIRVARNDVYGYPRVALYKDSKPRNFTVHRLVALAFIGECPDGQQVNHINGIRTDNRLENLEYVTPRQNTLHSYGVLGKKSPIGEAHGQSVLTESDVKSIRIEYAERGASKSELGRRFNVNRKTIEKIVRRQTWRHID